MKTRFGQRHTGFFYVQEVLYFAIEHKDVRREAFQDCTALILAILHDRHKNSPGLNPELFVVLIQTSTLE